MPGGAFRSMHIEYTHIGLTSFAVDACEETDGMEATFEARRKEQSESKRLLNMLKQEANPTLKRRKNCDRLAPRKRHKKADIVDGPGRPADDDPDDDLGDPDGGDASGADTASSVDELLVDFAADGCDEDPVDADAAGPVAARPARPRIEHRRHTANTDRVFLIEGNVYLGSISAVRRDQPSAAICLYCSRHGCTASIKVRDAPSTEQLLQRFEDGLKIEKGKTDRIKLSHKRLIPRPPGPGAT